MKKYVLLLGDFFLFVVVLFALLSRSYIVIPFFHTEPSSLEKGEYTVVNTLSTPTNIIFVDTTTHERTFASGVSSFNLDTEAKLLQIPRGVHVFPFSVLVVESSMIGFLILLVVFSIFWWQQTKALSLPLRWLSLALAFGWSGTISVAFLFVSLVFLFRMSNKKIRFVWEYAFLGLFFLWCLVTGFFARYPLNAVGSAFLFLIYAGIALVFSSLERNSFSIEQIASPVVASFFVAAGIGLFQQFFIKHDVGIWWNARFLLLWPYHKQEFVSLFEWAARGGYWLGLMLPVVFSALIHSPKEQKWKFLLGLIVGFVLLTLTQSRGGLIIALIAIFSQVLFLKRGYFALLLLIVPLLVVVAFPDSKWSQSLRHPLQFHTDVHRMDHVRAGKDFFLASPVWGIGLMNFKPYYYEKRHEYGIYAVADYLHQGYLAILVETGVVGFVLLYGFFAIVWVRFLKHNLSPHRTPICLVSWSIMNAFLVGLLFDAMLLYAFYLGIWVWFWIGLGES